MSQTEHLPESALRGVARLLMLLLAVLLLLPLCTLPIAAASLGGHRARYRTVMALTPYFCRIMAWCMGLHVSVQGHRSSSAKIFVGNHVSYLDILVAGIGVGGVFVSRHDVKDWPVIGIFARLAGTVFLDRRSLRSAIASSAGIVARAKEGIRIALFPEGKTTPGDGVESFKPFLFAAIAEEGFGVQPFTIRYRRIGKVPIDSTNKTIVYWYDPAPDLQVHGWRLLKLRGVYATVTFHEPLAPSPDSGTDGVRALAETLRERVAAGLA